MGCKINTKLFPLFPHFSNISLFCQILAIECDSMGGVSSRLLLWRGASGKDADENISNFDLITFLLNAFFKLKSQLFVKTMKRNASFIHITFDCSLLPDINIITCESTY